MKNHLKILNLFVAFILISSCVDTNTDSLNGGITESTQQLKYGTYAFKYAGLDAQEYLTFTLKNGDFKGTLFLYDEYFGGKVFYKLKGNFVDDSLFIGSIHTETDDLDCNWTLVFWGDSLSVHDNVDQFPFYSKTISMKRIGIKNLPNIEDCGSVEDMELEFEVEASENTPSVCFHKYYPNASSGRRTTQKEYLKVWLRGDYINGIGAGYSEGDPDWRLEFEGTQTNDTTYSINATYTPNGEKSFNTEEVWVIPTDQSALIIKSVSPDTLRGVGSVPFHQIDCEHIDDWAVKLMNN